MKWVELTPIDTTKFEENVLVPTIVRRAYYLLNQGT
jgi:hypothetical protein